MKHTRITLSLALGLSLLTIGTAVPVRAQLPPIPGNIGNKYKTKISKAKTTLDRIERHLTDARELFERADGEKRLCTPAEISRIETTLGKCEKYAGEIAEHLDGLPSLGEITPLKERQESAVKLLDELKNRLTTDKAKSDGQSATLEAGMEKDKAAVEALSALGSELSTIKVETSPETIAKIPRFEKDAQKFVDTYGELTNAKSNDATMMKRAAGRLVSSLKEVRTSRDKAVKENMPRWFTDDLKRLEELAKGAIQSGQFLGYTISPVEGNLLNAIKNYRTLAPGVPDADLALADRTEARVKELRSSVDKAAEKVISKNRPRPNTYQGSDAAAVVSHLKEVWKKVYPNEAILGVRLYDSWARTTAWEWDDFHSRWEKADYSMMNVAILVKSSDGKYAWQRHMRLVHNHLKGNALGGALPPSEGMKPFSPFDIIPLANM
jgi:hypothetical protein